MASLNLEEEVHRLQKELATEKQRSHALELDIKRMKNESIQLSQQVEAEEEAITNRLMKRLSDLKKEKEDLAIAVEQEEELLTNTLQKKLQDLRMDKVNMENQLETEQEYIVNRLQKKLDNVTAEKTELENKLKKEIQNREQLLIQVEREEEHLTNNLQRKLDELRREKIEIETRLETEEEYIVNRLQKQLAEVTAEKQALEKKLDEEGLGIIALLQENLEKYRNLDLSHPPSAEEQLLHRMATEIFSLRPKVDKAREDLAKFKALYDDASTENRKLTNENFALKQRVQYEKEMRKSITNEITTLEAEMEMDSERRFNEGEFGRPSLPTASPKGGAGPRISLSPLDGSRQRSASLPPEQRRLSAAVLSGGRNSVPRVPGSPIFPTRHVSSFAGELLEEKALDDTA
eukprot:GILK01002682.1.p1 GENE.GILK01002682.1~~GILK01002682.1.p1  ORF type:complete len:418 (+),score=105.70 GILK01002682.1:41-1255(+)